MAAEMHTWNTTICLAKRFIRFLGKDTMKETFFVFTSNFIEQRIHHFVPLFCNLSGIFIIPSSQNFLSFGQADTKPVSTSIAAMKLYTTCFSERSYCTEARIYYKWVTGKSLHWVVREYTPQQPQK